MKLSNLFIVGFSLVTTAGCSTTAIKMHDPEKFWFGKASERTDSEVEIKLTFVSGNDDNSDALGFLTLTYPKKKFCRKNETCQTGLTYNLELEGKRKGDTLTLHHTQLSDGAPKKVTLVKFKDPRSEFLNVEIELIQMLPYSNVVLLKSILIETNQKQSVAQF